MIAEQELEQNGAKPLGALPALMENPVEIFAEVAATDDSLSELLGKIVDDLQSLARGEIALARAEIGEKVADFADYTAAIVGGGLLIFASSIIILLGCAATLARLIPIWAALLVTGFFAAAAGGLVVRSAIAKLRKGRATLAHSTKSIERDLEVVKEHI